MRAAPAVVALAAAIALAGCGDGGGSESPPTDVEADAVVEGTAGLQYEPADVTLPTGGGTLALVCAQGPAHDITLTVDGDEEKVVECKGGEAVTEGLDLADGTYEFWCSVPGHRAAGMEGTITVGG